MCVLYIYVASCHSARYRCNGNEFQYACIWCFFFFFQCAHVFNYFVRLRLDWSMNILITKIESKRRTDKKKKKNVVHVLCVHCHVVHVRHIMKLAFPFVVSESALSFYSRHTLTLLSSFHIPKIKDKKNAFWLNTHTRSLILCDSIHSIQVLLSVVRFRRTGVSPMVFFNMYSFGRMVFRSEWGLEVICRPLNPILGGFL